MIPRVCVCVCVYIMLRQQLFFSFFSVSISLSNDDARRFSHTQTCTRGVCRICVRDKDKYLRITQLRGVQSRFLSIKNSTQHKRERESNFACIIIYISISIIVEVHEAALMAYTKNYSRRYIWVKCAPQENNPDYNATRMSLRVYRT